MLTLDPPSDLVDTMSSLTTRLRVVGDDHHLTESEKGDLTQTIVEAAVDAVMRSFTEISDAVIIEIEAGGQRARKGGTALAHIEVAMQRVELWAARASTAADPTELMSELLNTIVPLQRAYAVIS